MVNDLVKSFRSEKERIDCKKFVTRKSDLLERHREDRKKSLLLNEDV